MSISGQGHSLTLVKGHSDFKVKCLNFGLYTQVSNSGPLGPLVYTFEEKMVSYSLFSEFQMKSVHLISKYFSLPLPLTKLLDEGIIAQNGKKQALVPPQLVYQQSCLGIQWLFFGLLI